MRLLLYPIDLIIFSLAYTAMILSAGVLHLNKLFTKKKSFSAKRILQLTHDSISGIENEGLSHKVFRSDINGYFEKVVTILFARNSSCFFDKGYNSMHRIISIPQQPHNILKNLGMAKTNFAFSVLRLLSKCREVCREEDISLIRAQDPFMLGLAAYFTSRKTLIPYSIHVIQNYDISTRQVQRLVFPPFIFRTVEDKIERRVFRNALFITSSYINYKFYAICHGARPDNVFSLKTHVSEIHFRDPASRVNLKERLSLGGRHALLYVGRLERIKFVEDLIRCLSLVKEKVHNVSLLIAGEGSLKDELVSIAKELGVEDSLLLLGNVSQDMLSDLYYSADVILFTHAGITLVEAALSGRPIASYDHDWAGEFIGYEERGLLAEFRDVDALAQRVIRLLKDGALSAVLGRAARDFALKHFNEKEISDIERSVFEKFFKKDT